MNDLFSSPLSFRAKDDDSKPLESPGKAPIYDQSILLDLLFDKHTAEYNQYTFERNLAVQKALDAENAIKAAEEAEQARFSVEKAAYWAGVYLKREIEGIVNKHGYVVPAAHARYYFVVGNVTRVFNTFEFAESFARITGLKFSSGLYHYPVSISNSNNIGYVGTSTGSELYDVITGLRSSVGKLEESVAVLKATSNPVNLWDKLISGVEWLSKYGIK